MKEIGELDWKLAITGNVGMAAFRMAMEDPECKKELKPILEERHDFLDRSSKLERDIIARYKDKYFDKLMKRKIEAEENVSKLLLDEFRQRKEKP